MRAFETAKLIIAAVALYATQSQAMILKSSGQMLAASAPLIRVSDNAVCSPRYRYACWSEPYGRRFCGCWADEGLPACPSGYRYACRQETSGRMICACY